VREALPALDLVATLTASLATGLAELDAIVAETAAETGLAPAVLADYYTRNLRFTMGPAEQAGLAEYLRRAAARGSRRPPGSAICRRPLRPRAESAAARAA